MYRCLRGVRFPFGGNTHTSATKMAVFCECQRALGGKDSSIKNLSLSP